MIIETKKTNKKTAVIVLALVFAVLLATGSFRYFSALRQESQSQTAADDRARATEDAFNASHLRNSPTALQDLFLDDIRNGVNDKVTKSAIYFITHRFFDNGGNIYEIYDFIEAHPELVFMKEAEAIYPREFDQLKKGIIPRNAVDRAIYIYCAYVEVLYKHGYADVAATATAANQYAKTAYYTTTIAKEMPKKEGAHRSRYAKRNVKKAVELMRMSKQSVIDIMDGKLTEKDIMPRDLLVGLNQYAAAIRYLEAMGYEVSSSPKSAKEIFEFTTEYAYRNVPALHHFTSLLNASTLAIVDGANPKDVRSALYPILDFDMKGRVLSTSILHRIIESRSEPKLPPDRIGETNMDIYSKRNTLRLAGIVPEFKTWLMSNGWVESDFQ
ncbi:MAG: hypothetical protein WAT81_04655 [Candidatus Moraniibacteriota bacterium]